MGETSLDRASNWGRRALSSLLDLVFPRHCAGCGRPGEVWCSICENQVYTFPAQACQKCFCALPDKDIYCPDCRSSLDEPLIASYAAYQGPLRRALLSLKYRPDRELANLMAGWLAGRWRASGWMATRVVPVPLAQERQYQRGFNQAELLAQALASQLALPCSPGALRRSRNTSSQVGLNHDERWQNVYGAFEGNPKFVSGQRLLLVDDLYTTGATMRACQRALGGAEKVFGLTVARA